MNLNQTEPVDLADLASKLERNSQHPDPVALSNALTAENISFFTFALMIALERHAAPMSLALLSRTVGHSYWAVRSQIVNTHYFAFTKPDPLVSAALTEDVVAKLARIFKRLNSQ
jgi:hypothetical protein